MFFTISGLSENYKEKQKTFDITQFYSHTMTTSRGSTIKVKGTSCFGFTILHRRRQQAIPIQNQNTTANNKQHLEIQNLQFSDCPKTTVFFKQQAYYTGNVRSPYKAKLSLQFVSWFLPSLLPWYLFPFWPPR